MNTMLKLSIVAVVLAAAGGVVALKQGDKPTANGRTLSEQSTTEASGEAPISPVNDQTQPAPVMLPQLVDLGATKCIPCQAMAPILEALREDFAGQFEVVFIDVWENRDASEGYGIKMIPTQIFFDAEGKELFRHEGFYSRDEILTKWSELGVQINMPANSEDAS